MGFPHLPPWGAGISRAHDNAYPGLLGPTLEWARGHGSVERFEGIHQALHFGLLLQPGCG